MKDAKRTTIYLNPALHRALRLKAIQAERSMSDLVNEAVRQALKEDAIDLAAFEERADEPARPFENVLKDLRRSGRL